MGWLETFSSSGARTRLLSVAFALGCFATLPLPSSGAPLGFNVTLIGLWIFLGLWSWALWFRPDMVRVLWFASFTLAIVGFLRYRFYFQAPLMILWIFWSQARQTRLLKETKGTKLKSVVLLALFFACVTGNAQEALTEDELLKMESSMGDMSELIAPPPKKAPKKAPLLPAATPVPSPTTAAPIRDKSNREGKPLPDKKLSDNQLKPAPETKTEKTLPKATEKPSEKSAVEIAEEEAAKEMPEKKDVKLPEKVAKKVSESPLPVEKKESIPKPLIRTRTPSVEIKLKSESAPLLERPIIPAFPIKKMQRKPLVYDPKKYEGMDDLSTLPQSEKNLIRENLPKPEIERLKAEQEANKEEPIGKPPKYLTGLEMNDFSSCSVYDQIPWVFSRDGSHRKTRLLMKDRLRHQSEPGFKNWEVHQVMDPEGFVTYIFRTALSDGRFDTIAIKDTIYNRFIETGTDKKQTELQDLKTLVNRPAMTFYSKGGASMAVLPSSIGRTALVIEQGKADGRVLPPIFIRGNTCDRPDDDENADTQAKKNISGGVGAPGSPALPSGIK